MIVSGSVSPWILRVFVCRPGNRTDVVSADPPASSQFLHQSSDDAASNDSNKDTKPSRPQQEPTKEPGPVLSQFKEQRDLTLTRRVFQELRRRSPRKGSSDHSVESRASRRAGRGERAERWGGDEISEKVSERGWVGGWGVGRVSE